ncbi:hypothetical protein K491DRAFT_719119 [Lophiostoma macrostomum CBS 122681]|uniref:Uncharacterized protein n=1 Tax=Lophiostoma macrostomum CBS 122681 TaxID=1314788 RepID=A0A6A6T106_9PLEO|nr:hypothetical protein K491DRAFT_719119 [Lophiostoma macrostomum CBS 122681]
MSQFPHAPPPGAYVPPTESAPPPQGSGFNPQQSLYLQQSQAPSPYQSSASTYGPPVSSQKVGSKAAFGQMLNQAVTTGKPMLNKLGKTLNSKLGSKSHAPTTPQHLQSYQNYQDHQQQHNQQHNQAQGQSFSPQPQWSQPAQQQQQQSTYTTPQQSPFPPSNYATPSSGHSGQNNYFSQQNTQPTNTHTSPTQQHHIPNYNSGQWAQAQSQGQFQGQFQQGQFQQGQFGEQGQASQALNGHEQHGQYGQQSGVVGALQSPVLKEQPASSHASTATSGFPTQPDQKQQYQQSDPVAQSTPPPPPPPQQFGAAPALPIHPNQQHDPHFQQQQQWAPMSPISQVPPPTSSLPSHSPAVQIHSTAPLPAQSPHPTPVSPSPEPQPATTEFVAELPADLSDLSLMEKEKAKPQQAPTSQYQAYQPPDQTPSPSQSFTIPRRAVSTSSVPPADPWRVADPSTELPTREFYMIADVVFDAMDRKYEPQNTGLMEASKLLESMRVLGLPEEAAQLFLHDSYTFFARLWALEGIPHVMVPCPMHLTPTWNFSPQSHSQDVMRIAAVPPPANAGYPSYMPALNRAGWYKYFFAEQLAEGDYLEKLLCSPVCRDVYKPSLLNQPDVAKWDRTEIPSLANRAQALRAALSRVCDEVAAEMGQSQNATSGAGAGAGAGSGPNGDMSQHGAQQPLQSMQTQQQVHGTANHNMVVGGQSFAGNAHAPRF